MKVKTRWSGRIGAVMLGSASLVLAAGAAASATPGATAHSTPSVGIMLRAPVHPGAMGAAAIKGATQVGSTNWSGYAQSVSTKNKFKAVKDFWTVPTVNTSKSGDQYSSDWVGIGGFSDQTLVQDGTEGDNIGGKAHYDAWTEILPAAEVVISGLTIHAGDKMEGLVQETATNTWKMTVFDLTTGKSGGRTVHYVANGESVEAIHERPEVGGSLATLATTTKVTFDPGSLSTAAPGTPTWKPLLKTVSGATLNEIFMLNNAGTAIIASPSAPDSDSDGFAVQDGATSPPPPKS
jgi:Peptidase A4 family